MRKVALLCLLVFSIALHAQEQGENNTMDNSVKNNTEIRTLSLEMGPSWINSKIYTSEGDFKGQVGLELGVEYTGHTLASKWEDLVMEFPSIITKPTFMAAKSVSTI